MRILEKRLGVRISKDAREKIDNLVAEGKVESISEFVKKAIDASLEK
ncbi:ribbon-helix-helix domain-containing protein [Candidatus Bathyarchaeota archaeon]|nr:ribbon-helix-helix domain-containing protein [Candidatus Bathyarchaeota archaeon]